MFVAYKRRVVSAARAKRKPQIFDLLQLSRQEQEIRRLCRGTLSEWKRWRQCMPDAIHSGFFRDATIKGMVLRSRARDAVRLYRFAKAKRISCFQSYIAALPKQHCFKRLAS